MPLALRRACLGPLAGETHRRAAGAAVAASEVACGRQVTDLESFLRFFLFHFIFLSRCFGLP